MPRKLRLAILFGGKSAEHEVSLQSARNIAEAADKKKYNMISELKEYPVLDSGPNFPIVGVPVLQAKTRWQGGIAIQMLQKGINCLVDFFLAECGELFKASVKAGFEFVSHLIPSDFLNACVLYQNPRTRFPARFSVGQA